MNEELSSLVCYACSDSRPRPQWDGHGKSSVPSVESLLVPIVVEGEEVLKRLYWREDYQKLIQNYTPVLIKQLEQDPEALQALEDILKEHGFSLVDTDRSPTAAGIVICFAVGAAIGALAKLL